jgi:DNA polymerase-1
VSDETIYVMDAMSSIHQVFHAYPYMESPSHRPVQAIYGSIKDLLRFYRDFSPEYIVAAFDARGRNWRHELYDDYKANRPRTDSDLLEQFPYIRRIYEAFRIPCFAEAGFEADDTICTITKKACEAGYRVQITTIDKDARSLVNDRVKLLNLRTKTVMDAQGVVDKHGVKPEQIIDYLAIMGDSSDNVPGLPGVGAKGAAQLLTEYGTLEECLANAAFVKSPKQRNSLRDHADLALLSKQLVTLRDDVPIEVDFQACRVHPPDMEALRAICTECGFVELWDEIQHEFNEPVLDPIESYVERESMPEIQEEDIPF